MDFYVTVSSGPTKDFPDNETSWGEYYLEKPIELVGQYEVALVQSVFENIHSNNLGTINFFPSSTDMDMMTYKITANDGDSIEKIIQNTNSKIAEMASNYNYFKNNKELDQIPKIILDKDKSEFYFDLPENWQYFFTDLNGNHIYESYKYKNQTF